MYSLILHERSRFLLSWEPGKIHSCCLYHGVLKNCLRQFLLNVAVCCTATNLYSFLTGLLLLPIYGTLPCPDRKKSIAYVANNSFFQIRKSRLTFSCILGSWYLRIFHKKDTENGPGDYWVDKLPMSTLATHYLPPFLSKPLNYKKYK